MKPFAFFWMLSLLIVPAFSQTQVPITYQALKAYEGAYEYRNQSPFQIAASPKDNRLYALINEVKFELSYLGNDLFISKAQEKLQFYRNETKQVIGYILDNTKFNLISKKVSFTRQLWLSLRKTQSGQGWLTNRSCEPIGLRHGAAESNGAKNKQRYLPQCA
jgi:uncharacterized protein YaaR (DUF327 family)